MVFCAHQHIRVRLALFFFWARDAAKHDPPRVRANSGDACRMLKGRAEGLGVSAQVGEWLKPADCKSAPPCEVRRFESSPVHQVEPFARRLSYAEIPSGARDLK